MLRLLFGSFYSAELYRELRHEAKGTLIGYVIFLLVVMTVLSILLTAGHMLLLKPAAEVLDYFKQAVRFYQLSFQEVALVMGITLALRGIMLFALAIAGRLVALWLKPRMTYNAALRMAAVAYTPAALGDAISFGWYGMLQPNPFILFGAGLAMLLAAIAVTR